MLKQFSEIKLLRSRGLFEDEKTTWNQSARHHFVMDAIRRATNDKLVFIFLFWQDSDTRNA